MILDTTKQSIFKTGKKKKSKHQEILINFHFKPFFPTFYRSEEKIIDKRKGKLAVQYYI